MIEMPPVPSLEDIKENYRQGAGIAPARYKKKVGKANWHDPASSEEAQALYVAKISDPAVQARRQRKIAAVPNTVWQKQSDEVGGARIGPGMTAAVDKQAAGFAPYKSVIENTTLGAKTTDPAQNVMNRVIPLAVALHNKKMET